MSPKQIIERLRQWRQNRRDRNQQTPNRTGRDK